MKSVPPFARRGATYGATRRAALVAALCVGLPLTAGSLACREAEPGARPAATAHGPNVLWVVWDTVRADHLGLYGHERATTPRLQGWARDARVYTDATSPASYTLPSHASMFTGLLPSEHCAHNGHRRLDDRFTTIAELLGAAGYRTFLYSANPNVSALRNLDQGFDATEHPWSPQHRDAALRIVREKLASDDHSSELRERIDEARAHDREPNPWNIKAAGAIASGALLDWLRRSDGDRPFFTVLNYMEAHRPLIPSRAKRLLVMSPQEMRRSYEVDRSWEATWEYTFGLRDFDEDEIELTRKTYDAALLELDQLFAELLRKLGDAGYLDDTVVVLTSDHGEQLGEHHMLDHQYALYQTLLHVPLVVHYPKRFAPGRDDSAVMNFDLFPTLLELAGLPVPPGLRAHSLLDAPASREARKRMAEDPSASRIGIDQVRALHPDWDPRRWQRSLEALIDGPDKLIRGSDGVRQLYDLAGDPLETRNLAARQPGRGDALALELDALQSRLVKCEATEHAEELSEDDRHMLEALGYLESHDE